MRDMFPIPLYHESTLNDFDLESLQNDILEQRAEIDTGKPHKDYTSFFNKDAEDKMEGVLKWPALCKHIALEASRFAESIGIKNSINVDAISPWWNVYTDTHHCWHNHGDALLAGTFYVHMPEECQDIQFKSPIEGLVRAWSGHAFEGTRWMQEITIRPRSGDLLMWPSWLDHTVPQIFHIPEENRVSISFNVSMRR